MNDWNPEVGEKCSYLGVECMVKLVCQYEACIAHPGVGLQVVKVSELFPPLTPEQKKRDKYMSKINDEAIQFYDGKYSFVKHLLNIGLIQLPCDEVVPLSLDDYKSIVGGLQHHEVDFKNLAENNHIKVKQ